MAKGEGKGKASIGCLICVSLIVGIALAVLALVGLCLAIYHVVDFVSRNDELMSLANLAVDDNRLQHAYYVFIGFTVAAQVLSCVGGKNKRDEEEESKLASFIGSAFSLALIAGHMSCAIMGSLYKDDTIPKMRENMVRLINTSDFIDTNATTNINYPRYTKMGQYYNFLQSKYECCGVNRLIEDYVDANFTQRFNLSFPYSCCKIKPDIKVDYRNITRDDVEWEDCRRDGNPAGQRFTQGCGDKEVSWLRDKANFILGYNIALLLMSASSFILLLLIIFCAVCCGGN